MERFRYDRSSKWLIEHHGNQILFLGNIRDIDAWRPAQAEVVQPRQLPDGLLEVRRRGEQHFHPYIIEIETYPDRSTPQQLIDDVMLVYQDRRELPDVLVLVLRPKGAVEISDEIAMQSRGGSTWLKAGWRVVELWKLNATDLLATGEPGLMPWVGLTHLDGPPEPILQQCRRIIDEKSKPEEHDNLLAVSQVFLGLNYNDPRLFDILGGREAMIESPVLQQFVAEQLAEKVAEEVAEELRRTITEFLAARFGIVPPQLVASLEAINDKNQLRAVVKLAGSCTSLDDFERQFATSVGKRDNEILSPSAHPSPPR